MSTIDVSESGHGHHKGHRSNHHKISKKVKRSVTDEAPKLKLPGIIRRKFVEYSRAPANFTALYHSIPVTSKCSYFIYYKYDNFITVLYINSFF